MFILLFWWYAFCIWMTSLSYGLDLSPYASDLLICTTLEEGTPGAITCSTTPGFEGSMGVSLERNGVFVEVSSCEINGSCTNRMPSSYYAELITTKDDKGSTTYVMRLVILKANKSETLFRCGSTDSTNKGDCKVEVYVKPVNPTCLPVVLVESGLFLNITCSTEKVYPEAQATIVVGLSKLTKPSRGTWRVTRQTYRVYPSPTYPGYNATEITSLVPLTGALPGFYQFYALMYPNLANKSTANETAGVKSSLTNILELAAPVATIASECPAGTNVKDGYIMAGTTATCKCELSNTDNSPGQARWYKIIQGSTMKDGVENKADRTSTLSISYNPSDVDPSYECRADTWLKVTNTSTIPFSPKFASGPDFVDIEVSSGHNSVVVTCKVPFASVTPNSPLFSILVNNEKVEQQQQGTLISGAYVHSYTLMPAKGGNYAISCKAENSLFAVLAVEKSMQLQVRKPPTTAPIITISGSQSSKGNNTVYVTDATTVVVICRVDGGFPTVREDILSCGTSSKQTQSKTAALDLEVTYSLDGLRCYCIATHDTGCYNKEAMIVLRVQAAQPPSNDTWKIGIGAGVGCTVLLVTAGVATFLVLYRRKQSRRNITEDQDTGNNNAELYLSGSAPYVIPVDTENRAPDHYDLIEADSASSVGLSNSFSFTDPRSVGPTPHRVQVGSGTYIDPL